MSLKERIVNIPAFAATMIWLLLSAPISAETGAEPAAPSDTVFADRFQHPGEPVKPIQPTGDISLEIASHWGGPVHGADIQGDYAYIANGRMLRILDISDETNPAEVGALQLGTGSAGVRDVKVSGNYAFVAADGEDFFSIVDVSNPATPLKVHSFSGSTSGGARARTVELYENYAYVNRVSSGGGPILIYDVSNPANASQVGSIAFHTSEFSIHSSYLHAGGEGSEGIKIYDLSANPSNPVEIGSIAPPIPPTRRVQAIAANENYVYALFWRSDNPTGFLMVADISSPGQPIVTDVITVQDEWLSTVEQSRMVATPEFLYFANHHSDLPRWWGQYESLLVFDLTEIPGKLQLEGTYKPHGDVSSIFVVTDNRAYIADPAAGFVILDVADPSFIQAVGNYHSPAILREMVSEGDLLYVTDAWGGFTVLDVSNSEAPTVVGNYLARRHDTAGIDTWGIVKDGDTIYLAGGGAGLLTVDVSDPAHPVTIGVMRISTMPFSSSPWCGARFMGLRVQNNIAYLGYLAHFCSYSTPWLLTVDVSNPMAPAAIGVHSAGGWGGNWAPSAIAFGPGQSLLINSSNLAFDISDPANPINVFSMHGPNTPFALTVKEDLMYSLVAETQATNPGLNVHDISNPANPLPLLWIQPGDPVGCGNFPSISDRNGGLALGGVAEELLHVKTYSTLYTFDVTNPTAPVCINRLDEVYGGTDQFRGLATGLLNNGSSLFMSSEILGLTLLNLATK